ncbi:nicotinate phosphoribosyltransferase isoform X1 [Topomyia yanbarensis]|uniref:nicotinate phosphoribosyltransferase isoform X1 n=1 Tax=Topomyia yanbarensis TaxID=2498891 RepID=UPI00273AEEFE|nr:nicotinate phosphoribosyltransferase isoform X1 [Topomyia yanbarensis]XP_058817920.1 nicotinate phosphoribosyltransferase isoform X1 [Topomyia yanbarensis]
MMSSNGDDLPEDGAFASSKNSWNRYYHNSVVQPLLTDLYQITMAYAYWKSGKVDDHAVFDLFFRTNPFQGEFTIFAGLEECLKFIENFHYSETDMEYLKHALPQGIEEEFFEYLSQLTAKDVTLYAIAEGSVAFPRIPLIKVAGPLIIVQLLETTLLTLVNYASLMATNAARYRMVAGRHINLLEFGLRRAQGPDGGLSASKYSYIGGFDGTSNVLAGKLFNIPVKGTHAHAYITSFTGTQELKTRVLAHKETGDKRDLLELAINHRTQLAKILDTSTDESSEGELAAMVSFAIAFPDGFMALVDTYDVKSERNDTKSTLLGDSSCFLNSSNWDLYGSMTDEQDTYRRTDDTLDTLDGDTPPEAETEQIETKEEEQEDGARIDASNCYYCCDSVTRVSDSIENGNHQQDEERVNNTNPDSNGGEESTVDPPDIECGPSDEVINDGQINGNGVASEYDEDAGEDNMTLRPRCARCEANARESKICVIGHLKAVGKCFRSGLLNFCAVALALNDQGYRAVGIRIDSGDLAYLSCLSRETFERIAECFKLPWFSKLTIVASNDINEETILSLNEQGHKIDCFGIGTHLVTCQRQPALGCVYKMVEINNQPRIKLSQDVAKVTMPGSKNVFRLYGADGHALIDLLQRVDESPPEVGQKVLCRHPFEESKRAYVSPARVETLYQVYWGDGRVTQAMPSLVEVRERVQNSLRTLRQDHKRTLNPTPYKVAVSDNLYNFIHDLWLQNAPIGELA